MVKLITAGSSAGAADLRTEIAAYLKSTTAGNWDNGFAAEYATTV
jgi:hypothetical protein